jgi:hypothetical protein
MKGVPERRPNALERAARNAKIMKLMQLGYRPCDLAQRFHMHPNQICIIYRSMLNSRPQRTSQERQAYGIE